MMIVDAGGRHGRAHGIPFPCGRGRPRGWPSSRPAWACRPRRVIRGRAAMKRWPLAGTPDNNGRCRTWLLLGRPWRTRTPSRPWYMPLTSSPGGRVCGDGDAGATERGSPEGSAAICTGHEPSAARPQARGPPAAGGRPASHVRESRALRGTDALVHHRDDGQLRCSRHGGHCPSGPTPEGRAPSPGGCLEYR